MPKAIFKYFHGGYYRSLWVIRSSNTRFDAATVFSSSQLSFQIHTKNKTFSIWRSLKVVRKLNTGCLAATVFPGFQLSFVMLKAIVKTILFLEVILGHQMVKHWIHCCYCISWVLIFRLICIQPKLKHFYFGGHFSSLEVIRRSNTGFVDATVFLGFLAFN